MIHSFDKPSMLNGYLTANKYIFYAWFNDDSLLTVWSTRFCLNSVFLGQGGGATQPVASSKINFFSALATTRTETRGDTTTKTTRKIRVRLVFESPESDHLVRCGNVENHSTRRRRDTVRSISDGDRAAAVDGRVSRCPTSWSLIHCALDARDARKPAEIANNLCAAAVWMYNIVRTQLHKAGRV